MFRTRRQLTEAKVELARAEAELALLRTLAAEARDTAERMRDAEASLQWQLQITREHEKLLEERNERLTEQLQQASVREAVLKERLDLVVNHGLGAAPQGEPKRMHVTEAEEDLAHAFSSGLISKEALEQELERAGLIDSEIQLDFQPSDYPRLGNR